MEKQIHQNEDVIDLLDLGRALLRKWWAIALCLVIGAAAAFGGTKLLITPQYTATSMIYILSESTSITSLADVQIGDSLAQDFMIIGKSRPVVEKVIKRLDLDASYEAVSKTITFENPTDSHILKISVTNPDPKLAADISNAVAEVTRAQIADVMGTDEPNTLEEAIVPVSPSSPNTMKNTMLGALLGAVLAAGLIIVLYLMDDTIKDEDDVKKYLQMNTLAALPMEKRRRGKSGKRVA
jgi:capsular polysaccharide biosynthesis protein